MHGDYSNWGGRFIRYYFFIVQAHLRLFLGGYMRSKYVERTLSAGESLIYETRLHKIKLFIPFLWIILCLPGTVFSFVYSNKDASGNFPYVMLMICLFPALPSLLTYWTSEFTVTNKRVVIKIGWLSRKTIELNINKVESLSFIQGILGRMLGYGNVIFTGTGGSKEIFKTVAKPLDFTNAVRKAQEECAPHHK
jgi:uncharacterized membrane protein YdbT with pleckstrin-like domain